MLTQCHSDWKPALQFKGVARLKAPAAMLGKSQRHGFDSRPLKANHQNENKSYRLKLNNAIIPSDI